jgi:hypothetical protein
VLFSPVSFRFFPVRPRYSRQHPVLPHTSGSVLLLTQETEPHICREKYSLYNQHSQLTRSFKVTSFWNRQRRRYSAAMLRDCFQSSHTVYWDQCLIADRIYTFQHVLLSHYPDLFQFSLTIPFVPINHNNTALKLIYDWCSPRHVIIMSAAHSLVILFLIRNVTRRARCHGCSPCFKQQMTSARPAFSCVSP